MIVYFHRKHFYIILSRIVCIVCLQVEVKTNIYNDNFEIYNLFLSILRCVYIFPKCYFQSVLMFVIKFFF